MTEQPHLAIIHYAAPPEIGGVEVTILHHARVFARYGYPVSVIAGRGEHFDPQITYIPVPEMDSQHSDVIALNKGLERGEFDPVAFETLQNKLVSALEKALDGVGVCFVHNIMCLHFNLPLTAAILQLAQGGHPTRFVAWNHDFSWTDPLHRAKVHPGHPWDVLRTPYPELTYVVVSNDRQAELADLLDLPPEEIEVITPGVAPSAFFRLDIETSDLIGRLDLFSSDMLLLLPARITELKNIELGIEVVAALKRQGLAAWLIVTGPPDPHDPRKLAYLDILRQRRAELDVTRQAIFLYEQGPSPDAPFSVSDEMIQDLYQICDVLFFPSKQEGFGIPVLEAGLARIPVFCSNIPPFRETAGDIAHFFELDESPDSIAGRIREVLSREETFAMRQRVLRKYSWRYIFKNQIEPLIERLLALPHPDSD